MAGRGTVSLGATRVEAQRDTECDLVFRLQGAAVLQGEDIMSNRTRVPE